MIRTARAVLSASAILLGAGCVEAPADRGEPVEEQLSGEPGRAAGLAAQPRAAAIGRRSQVTATTGRPQVTATVARPQVTLPPAALKLLPFDVRLRRVAAAVGVAVDDPVFDAARAQRLALGAHDFLNGTAPDLRWNSQRMAAWTTVMLPVCRDARARSHLGEWKQGGVQKFVEAAFGRASTDDDLADLTAALAITGDDGWVATCLSLVSAAEVLLQ